MPDQIADWVETATYRLMAVQASFADESADKRRDYLAEALDRLLDPVVPAERPRYLAALAPHFPHGEVSAAPISDRTRILTQDTEGADVLALRLAGAAPALDPAARARVIDILRQAGLAKEDVSTAEPVAGDAVERLRRMEKVLTYLMDDLQLDTVDLPRVVKLMIQLVHAFGSIGQMLGGFWKVVGAKSAFAAPEKIEDDLRHYLSRAKGVHGDRLAEDIRFIERLTAALMTALPSLAQAVQRDYLAQLPAAVRSAVEQEGGINFQAAEIRCWKRFEQFAAAGESDDLEQTVRAHLRSAIETTLRQSAQAT